jgi:Ca-activated chloride channel homolog
LKKILLIALLCVSCSLFGQQQLTRILFILDASNSMNARWGTEQTRIEAAKELLIKAVDSLYGTPNLEIALRVYGHQSPVTATFQDCQDTKLEVPFGKDNFQAIKTKIRTIKAKGTTPIARSLEAAAEDFPDMNARNIIILMTHA